LSQRLQINGNLFWANIKNYQTTVRDRVLVASYLATAKSARTRGAEVEVRWVVLDGLHLDTAVAYDDATYTAFDSAPSVSLWVRSAFDKDYFASLSVGGVFAAGYVAGPVGDPRTYGATLRLQF